MKKTVSRRKLLASSTTTLAGAALLPVVASAQKKKTTKGESIRFGNPSTLAKPRGYSHVAEVLAGRTIYIAGQLAQDKDGKVVGPGDFRAQCVQVFENLKLALTSVGADFTHVVKLTNYFTDMAHVEAFREVRALYVNTQQPPPSTAVQVVRLARPEMLIEVEAIAVVP
jgi:enamine deaminase RidA (YjgF/YER057c/UK114 family)